MPNEPDEKIARAVATCITYAAESERPFQQAADLLALLKISTGWTDEEIDDVRSRVLLALMKIRTDAADVDPK